MAGNRIALDVTDPALVLALGPRPVRRAGARPEPPVAGEGDEPLVEAYLPGGRVMMGHQGARIVEKRLPRRAPEVAEGRLDPSSQADCRSCRKARTNSRRE